MIKINMKKVISGPICLFVIVISHAQTYTPLQADSIFKSNNWKETIKAYTWLIENDKIPRPGVAWSRIATSQYLQKNFGEAIPAFKKLLDLVIVHL